MATSASVVLKTSALMLALLLTVASAVEARPPQSEEAQESVALIGASSPPPGVAAEGPVANPARGPTCDHLFSVKQDDTCDSITKLLDLSTGFFLAINPNINCLNLFVGQWVCVAGKPN